ncbi:hypothetical protein V6N13_076629 [Hibiscus sabdariffa]
MGLENKALSLIVLGYCSFCYWPRIIFLHFLLAVGNALEEFKLSVYGDNNYDEESDNLGKEKVGETSRKCKAIAENAAKDFDWGKFADK